MSLDDTVPAGEAARMLGTSPQRVRALISAGELPGTKVAGRWLVDRASVDRRLRSAKLTGRPLSSSQAWGLIAMAEGRTPTWLRADERSRLRALLRDRTISDIIPLLVRRARKLDLRAHASDLSRIESEPDVVRTGVSAAAEYELAVVAPGVLEAYVPDRRLAQLERTYRLQPTANANLVLHVVGEPWPFTAGQWFAPRLATIIELLADDEQRTRRAGQDALADFMAAR